MWCPSCIYFYDEVSSKCRSAPPHCRVPLARCRADLAPVGAASRCTRTGWGRRGSARASGPRLLAAVPGVSLVKLHPKSASAGPARPPS